MGAWMRVQRLRCNARLAQARFALFMSPPAAQSAHVESVAGQRLLQR
jgi:hypothetical protein